MYDQAVGSRAARTGARRSRWCSGTCASATTAPRGCSNRWRSPGWFRRCRRTAIAKSSRRHATPSKRFILGEIYAAEVAQSHVRGVARRCVDADCLAGVRKRHRAVEGVRRAGACRARHVRAAGSARRRARRMARARRSRRGPAAARRAARSCSRVPASSSGVREAVCATAAGRRRQALRLRQGPEPGHGAYARRRARREPGGDSVRQQRPGQELHAARRRREGRHRLARTDAESEGHAVPDASASASRTAISKRWNCTTCSAT